MRGCAASVGLLVTVYIDMAVVCSLISASCVVLPSHSPVNFFPSSHCLLTLQSAKAVYSRILDLKIATPQIIINFGMFLEENNYFEEAFKAYERGVGMFKWPHVFDIWNTYLLKFIKRYGGSKLERARDLFEQCLEGCPPKFAKCE